MKLGRKFKLGCLLAVLGLPSFVYAQNMIYTTLQTDQGSSFGIAWGNLHYYKIDRCEGKTLAGWQWSGERCYISTEINDAAWAPLMISSGDMHNWCYFTLTVVDTPGAGKPYEKFMETQCTGKFMSVNLKKVDDYHYEIVAQEQALQRANSKK